MELQTKRLVLKAHTIANAEKMNKWRNDRELLYYNDEIPEDSEPVPLEATMERMARYAGKAVDGDMVRLAIHKKEDGVFIGFCMIAFIDEYNKSCKFGITIGEKNEWGKGYSREVLCEIVRYCFEDLGLNRIGAEVYAFNERSSRLFESVGFRREGTIRQCVYKKGKFEDEYVYGLLKEEWRSTNGC